MSSKTRSQLEDATKISRDKGEETQTYLKRLARAVQDLDDAAWNKLSKDAQDWFNTACDAADAKKEVPGFDDEVEDDPAPTRRRRTSGDDEPKDTAPAKYEPKKGDKVRVTTKRGKVVEGTFVEMDKDDYVVDDGKEELLFPSDTSTIEPVEPPKEEGRRRRAAADDEPEGPADPEIGDTVEVTNQRGKVYVGILKDDQGDDIVIETLGGEIEDISKERIKSIVIKHKAGGKKADAPAEETSSRRRSSGGDDKATDNGKPRKVTKDDNDGVSVTTRTKELVIENPDKSADEIGALLKKEGLVFKDVTFALNYKETHRIMTMMKERGWKAPR